LGRGSHLSPQEIDLVLILLKAENYQDEGITHQLAAGFLEERKLNPAIEPLYLKAVTSGCKEADAIVRFVLPQLLERRRSDELALRFYWAALPYDPPGAEEARALLARSWCEKYWEGIDPGFHEKLGQVYQARHSGTVASGRSGPPLIRPV
ncbi:MAG: hypothetical protein GWM98_10665, partial [Nitrospinaceae bacterium]|nr:hypothetical protein [Nitrospinaceae bacterium]NIR54865.1 hypothetical protein [Nitrospinaceae bacterium]NIS85290.1 hypothetical protein [Nitrospinaceae bacterium]NIT82103.1 hypothetical protein [Nitrospinaceae bacterium]NIU44364.1 hypothetical protein [Nitrospinaceae bacterium]